MPFDGFASENGRTGNFTNAYFDQINAGLMPLSSVTSTTLRLAEVSRISVSIYRGAGPTFPGQQPLRIRLVGGLLGSAFGYAFVLPFDENYWDTFDVAGTEVALELTNMGTGNQTGIVLYNLSLMG